MIKAFCLREGMQFVLAGNICTIERVIVDQTYSVNNNTILRIEYNHPLNLADGVFGFMVANREMVFDIINQNSQESQAL